LKVSSAELWFCELENQIHGVRTICLVPTVSWASGSSTFLFDSTSLGVDVVLLNSAFSFSNFLGGIVDTLGSIGSKF
jgi:hypothetical protein